MDIVGRFEDVFCNAAIDKGDGTTPDDERLFETMKGAFTRLHNHPRGKEHILELLQHENNWVKIWVATQVLSEGHNSEASRILQLLSKESGSIGFSAEMVLSQHQSGELLCPFGIKP